MIFLILALLVGFTFYALAVVVDAIRNYLTKKKGDKALLQARIIQMELRIKELEKAQKGQQTP